MDAVAKPEIVVRLPKLYPKQRDAIFTDARYATVEASTKSGKTVACIVWILHEVINRGKVGRNWWWIAPVYPQAQIAYGRITRMLQRIDPDGSIWTSNKGEMFVQFSNGGRLWFKSGEKSDNLYGEDVWGAVVDEASRVREESWWALRSTLTATKGHVRIIGNVKGRKNWAYRMARKAESGAANHHYAKLTCWDAVDAEVLDRDEIDDARANLPEAVFNELYLAVPNDDDSNPFGLEYINACKTQQLAPGPVVAWGIDLAKSHDWTVAVGVNDNCQVAAFQRWQSNWLNTTHRICGMIKDTPSHIDSTGVGDSVVEHVQGKCMNAEGFTFTSKSKQQLMEGLAVAIQRGEVAFPDGVIVSELESFEHYYKRTGVQYSAPDGMFDDCVCALALAVNCHRVAAPQPVTISGLEDDDADDDAWFTDPVDRREMWIQI